MNYDMMLFLAHVLCILFYVLIIVVGYCLDVWKTQLQENESSAKNCVSESTPSFTVSRDHLHDYASQAIPLFFYALPV